MAFTGVSNAHGPYPKPTVILSNLLTSVFRNRKKYNDTTQSNVQLLVAFAICSLVYLPTIVIFQKFLTLIGQILSIFKIQFIFTT